MSEPIKQSIFYKKDEKYYCRATDEVCEKITQYFNQGDFKLWADYVAYLAKNKINKTFIQPGSENVCLKINCKLYETIKNLKAFPEIQK